MAFAEHLAADNGIIIMPVAGFVNGEPRPGETTPEAIETLFGDILPEQPPMSPQQYEAVIARCETNGWLAWKASWEQWRADGKV